MFDEKKLEGNIRSLTEETFGSVCRFYDSTCFALLEEEIRLAVEAVIDKMRREVEVLSEFLSEDEIASFQYLNGCGVIEGVTRKTWMSLIEIHDFLTKWGYDALYHFVEQPCKSDFVPPLNEEGHTTFHFAEIREILEKADVEEREDMYFLREALYSLPRLRNFEE